MASKSRLAVAARTPPQIEGNPVRNELLLAIPPAEGDSIFSQLTFVQLRNHDVLQECGEHIKYAYFMNSGLASVLNSMRDGKNCGSRSDGKRRMHWLAHRGWSQNQRFAHRSSSSGHRLPHHWPRPIEYPSRMPCAGEPNTAVRPDDVDAGSSDRCLQPPARSGRETRTMAADEPGPAQ